MPADLPGTRAGHAGPSPRRPRIPFIGDVSAQRRDLQRLELELIARYGPPPGEHAGPITSSTRGSRRSSWRFGSRPRPPKCRISRESRRRRSGFTGSTTQRRPISARSACWRGDSPSGAFASFNVTSAAGTLTINLKTDHGDLAHAIDKPIAGLLTDLKAPRAAGTTRSSIWGGEFGRTPTCEGTDGRDHNPHGLHDVAGRRRREGRHRLGARPMTTVTTPSIDKVHVHDLHATILHLLGLDHKRLTFRYAGRDFRLTDVHGELVEGNPR